MNKEDPNIKQSPNSQKGKNSTNLKATNLKKEELKNSTEAKEIPSNSKHKINKQLIYNFFYEQNKTYGIF